MSTPNRPKQHLFIYDRKEMIVLMCLALMISAFAFTLGVHLGKKVVFKGVPAPLAEANSVPNVPDHVPNRQEIAEQSKGVDTVIDESLNQELHDEVAKNGLKLGNSRQVDLPKEPKAEEGGATTLKRPAPAAVAAAGNFTLQVGSHPALEEAKNQMTKLEEHGLKPYLKEVELGGKGKWYRVYLGDFASKDTAEKAGEKYRSEQVIRSFIVAKNAAQ